MRWFVHICQGCRLPVILVTCLAVIHLCLAVPTKGQEAADNDTPTNPQTVGPTPAAAEEKGSADTDVDESSDDNEALEEEEAAETPAIDLPLRGNSIQRQQASVRRQLGRGPQGRDAFFISSWFSGDPGVHWNARSGTTDLTPPEDCDPLDPAIAEAYIRDSSMREGVSMDLVREVVRKESGFKPCSVSPKGAMGLMQLMPDTASALGVMDPFNPRENIDGGVRLLRRLLDKYQGRPDLALAAYNAGEGAVDSANGVPDFAETKEYVAEIMKRVFETPPSQVSRRSPARVPKPVTRTAKPASPPVPSIPAPPAVAPTPSP